MPREKQGYVYFWKERNSWYARLTWTDDAGRRRQRFKAVKNKTEGNLFLKETIRSLDQNQSRAVQAHSMMFRALAAIYEERELVAAEYHGETRIKGLRSWQKQRAFLKTLVDHFGSKRVQSITWGDLDSYRAKHLLEKTRLGSQRSVAMVNRELSLMKTILNYARKEGWIVQNPFSAGNSLVRLADEVKRDRILTESEESRLLAACTGPREHLRLLIICAIDTGMRKSEQLALLWSDVDFAEGLIRVRGTTTKTRKSRTVGLTVRLKRELEKLQETASGEPDSRIFNQADIKRSFGTACRKAGITNLKWHDLRHTNATRLLEAGIPAQQVMKLTGHTQMATFLRYITANDDVARKAAGALSSRVIEPVNIGAEENPEYVN